MPAPRLKLYAHVLDFFGSMFEIRDGKAIVPGGARAEKAWAEMAGAEPSKGAACFERLLSREDGWLASYLDALARMDGPVKEYLTDPDRLPARGVVADVGSPAGLTIRARRPWNWPCVRPIRWS